MNTYGTIQHAVSQKLFSEKKEDFLKEVCLVPFVKFGLLTRESHILTHLTKNLGKTNLDHTNFSEIVALGQRWMQSILRLIIFFSLIYLKYFQRSPFGGRGKSFYNFRIL